MAGARLKTFVAVLAAGSMLVGSTSAVAATPSAAAPQQVSPWAALTALSAGAPAATLCGAAAAAAAASQAPASGCVLPAVDAPPPVVETAPPAPAPLVAAPPAYAATPLFLALGALAVGALVYFFVRNNHNHHISPA